MMNKRIEGDTGQADGKDYLQVSQNVRPFQEMLHMVHSRLNFRLHLRIREGQNRTRRFEIWYSFVCCK
jgi:hypothetical protein